MGIDQEIAARLKELKVVPLLGGLIPEKVTAELLGYSENRFRELARTGAGPLPFITRGNRRFYKTNDIARYVTSADYG